MQRKTGGENGPKQALRPTAHKKEGICHGDVGKAQPQAGFAPCPRIPQVAPPPCKQTHFACHKGTGCIVLCSWFARLPRCWALG